MERTEGTTNIQKYRVIGVMSGSSLDGIDLALCEFSPGERGWSGKILKARTLAYGGSFKDRLERVMSGTALELARLHVELGKMIGEACRDIAQGGQVDLIASHGHTIFHRPGEALTTQIGSGAGIAAVSGITTVCDFRTTDVALGGQGAPLVPLGEKLLFPEHTCFINLGGIANMSVHRMDRVTGYDISPCNSALNLLAAEAGQAFDDEGAMAASGNIIAGLLEQLNALPFYELPPPRSLGREWFEEHMRPLIKGVPDHLLNDRLRTVAEHVAMQLATEIKRHKMEHVMVTGGGAHNHFLIQRLRELSGAEVVLPEKDIIDFKEALIFALLGVLRLRGEPNALASVTGAKKDSVGGAVYVV